MKKVLVITGATAVGKSDISIQLAQRFNGEIINADSQQVYQELNIATAKVDHNTRLQVPHHGLDLITYDQSYSVMDYQRMARQAIDACHQKQKLPILVGGSGLYLKACLYDYHFETDQPITHNFDEMSNAELYEQLQQHDEQASLIIHPNNRKRVIRALTIAFSGKNKSQREADQNKQLIYDVLIVVLDRDRAQLHQRIEQRIEQMFKQGLQEEVETYFSNPRTWTYQSFQAIGYKEWRAYFEHGVGVDQVKQAMIVATRQYAKRQLTWFRHQFDGLWFNIDENSVDALYKQINEWLKKEAL
jgi:tRNA dimethylallyltransferase